MAAVSISAERLLLPPRLSIRLASLPLSPVVIRPAITHPATAHERETMTADLAASSSALKIFFKPILVSLRTQEAAMTAIIPTTAERFAVYPFMSIATSITRGTRNIHPSFRVAHTGGRSFTSRPSSPSFLALKWTISRRAR